MQNTHYTDLFKNYFETQFWGNKEGSSGPNSAFSQTSVLRKNLENLLSKLPIKTLLDAGCGDANLFKHMQLPDSLERIIGIECVAALTEQNQDYFKNLKQFEFMTLDLITGQLPKADLILCRDVVHYWPNSYINLFLHQCLLSGAKYLLITHNIYSDFSANSPTEFGIFRPVNLTQKPFCWPAPVLTLQEDVYGKELALFQLK